VQLLSPQVPLKTRALEGGVGRGRHFIREPILVDQLRQRSWDDCKKAPSPRNLWERLQGESSDETTCFGVRTIAILSSSRRRFRHLTSNTSNTNPPTQLPALTRSIYIVHYQK